MTGAGVAAALLAALANAFAIVLQASEARQTPDREGMHASLLRRLAHRRRWMAGTALMVVGGILQVVALSLVSLSVVQPALATSALVLLGVARVRLGERIGRAEVASALALVIGLCAVVVAAPGHSAGQAPAGRLVAPMGTVGAAALIASAVGRWHRSARLSLVIGAGLGYAEADFTVKLLSGAGSDRRWALVGLWLAIILAAGCLAFLEENTALQHRPVVTVAPVIAALKVPLPVIMAVVSGLQGWTTGASGAGVAALGLALVVSGAVGLGRSQVVGRVTAAPGEPSGHEPATA